MPSTSSTVKEAHATSIETSLQKASMSLWEEEEKKHTFYYFSILQYSKPSYYAINSSREIIA